MRRGKSLFLSCILAFKEAVLLKLGPKPKQALLITISVALLAARETSFFVKAWLPPRVPFPVTSKERPAPPWVPR